MAPHRVLGLTARATNVEVKAAYKALAKQWHPDSHQGAAKVRAEEKFKTILSAYQALTGAGGAQQEQQQQQQRQQQQYYGAASRSRSARHGHNWGNAEAFGPAGRPGYDPHEGYMGFGPGGKHWYEDTQAAASKTEERHRVVMWTCIGVFAFGLWAVQSSSASDKRAKERGELVDAWFNPTSRRWEEPRAAMYKDPMLSQLVMLKPPGIVHKAGKPGANYAARRPKQKTLDGVALDDAYRARQTGSRSGA